jgi:ATP-dependent Clp protease adaptor protein ClpS
MSLGSNESTIRTVVRPRAQNLLRRLPPFAIVLHNDDINTFDFVIEVLCEVFKYDIAKAAQLTLMVHHAGQGIVWTGSLEVAELKAEQIRGCGADPTVMEQKALPLTVSIEPLPE